MLLPGPDESSDRAAIASNHDPTDGTRMGKSNWFHSINQQKQKNIFEGKSKSQYPMISFPTCLSASFNAEVRPWNSRRIIYIVIPDNSEIHINIIIIAERLLLPIYRTVAKQHVRGGSSYRIVINSNQVQTMHTQNTHMSINIWFCPFVFSLIN